MYFYPVALSRKVLAVIAILLITVTSFITVLATSSASYATNPAPNPAWPDRCGLKIGLLIDRSNSVGLAGATVVNQYRAAAKGFVDALTGTPSQISVATFRNVATQNLGLTSVASATGPNSAQTVKNTIDGISFPSDSDFGSTNWESAFTSQLAIAADVIVILTDGNPTTYGDGSTGGAVVNQIDIDRGVEASNAVKAQGKRVVAVGIGSGVSTPNLQAISGPTANDDYFTSSFSTLNEKLNELAIKLCGGTVTVRKVVKDAQGNYNPANGWDYTATNAVATSKTTSGDGTAEFEFSGTTATTITETLKPGYLLESVECKKNQQTIATSQTTSVNLNVGPQDIITCEFKNRPDSANLTIVKNATGANGTFNFTTNIPGHTSKSIATANNTGNTGSFTIPAGTFNITETVPSGWTLDSLSCTGAQTTVNNPTVTITAVTDANIVCTFNNSRDTAQIRVVKNTGQTYTGSFNFNTNTPLGNFSLNTNPSGTAQTGSVTIPTGNYSITETVPANWGLTNATCTNASSNLNGSTLNVTVTKGANIVCTFTNARDTANVRIVKNTVGGEGSGFNFTTNLPGGNFSLSTVGQTNYIDFTIPSGVAYSVTEQAKTDWDLTGLSCTGPQGSTQVNGASVSINAPKDANIVCTYTNTRQTGTIRIVKNTVDGNGTFNFNSTIPGNTTFGLTTVGGTATTQSITVPTGSYDISEIVPAGWELDSVSCTNANYTVDGDSVDVFVSNDTSVVCTFTNTRDTALVRIVKNTADGYNGSFTFNGTTPIGEVVLNTVDGTDQTSFIKVPTGNYSITETVPTGWGLTSADCSGTDATLNNATISFTAAKDAQITCTFENTRDTASVRIVKNAIGAEGSFDFETDLPGGDFTLNTVGLTNYKDFTIPTGVDFDVEELSQEGWELTDLSCEGPDGSTEIDDNLVTINAPKNANIVCTFENTRQTGSITIVKTAIGGNDEFNFSTNIPGNTSPTLNTVGGTDQETFNSVPTGTYTIEELSTQGWTLTDIDCDSGRPDVEGTAVSITLTAGQNVTCTFENTRDTGTITVLKNAVGGNSEFSFESNTPLGDFSITTEDGTGTSATETLDTGLYDISEIVPQDWTLEDVSCEGGQWDNTGDTSIIVDIAKDSDVVCTFTNVRDTGSLTVVKRVIGDDAGFNFTSNSPLSDFSITTVEGEGSTDTFTVDTGTYEITELARDGWNLTGLFCEAVPSDGGEIIIDEPIEEDVRVELAEESEEFFEEIDVNFTVEGSTVSVDIEKDEDVICVFENTQEPEVLPTVVTRPSPGDDVQVGGITAQRLPATGANSTTLFGYAVAILALGIGLFAARRRRFLG